MTCTVQREGVTERAEVSNRVRRFGEGIQTHRVDAEVRDRVQRACTGANEPDDDGDERRGEAPSEDERDAQGALLCRDLVPRDVLGDAGRGKEEGRLGDEDGPRERREPHEGLCARVGLAQQEETQDADQDGREVEQSRRVRHGEVLQRRIVGVQAAVLVRSGPWNRESSREERRARPHTHPKKPTKPRSASSKRTPGGPAKGWGSPDQRRSAWRRRRVSCKRLEPLEGKRRNGLTGVAADPGHRHAYQDELRQIKDLSAFGENRQRREVSSVPPTRGPGRRVRAA